MFFTLSAVSVRCIVGAILGNRYGIQGHFMLQCIREVKCEQGFSTGICYKT